MCECVRGVVDVAVCMCNCPFHHASPGHSRPFSPVTANYRRGLTAPGPCVLEIGYHPLLRTAARLSMELYLSLGGEPGT